MRRAPKPLVSVVLAVHDGAATLRLAVASILRQTLEELELVVVDDRSTDGTAELLDGISDDRLVVLRNDEQLGLARSLNLGLEHASSRYVARLDADDVALPERLERQLAAMRARAGLGVLGTAVVELGAQGPGALHLMPRGDAAVRWHLLFSSPFFHPSVLVDRELLDAHGLRYDAAYLESEDYELWSRLLGVASGENLADPLVLYRRHAGQASERRRDLQRSFQLEVALREIARVAPALEPGAAELAWRLGSGDDVPAERRDEAVAAYVGLLRAFERARGRDAGVRAAAARVLARAGEVRQALAVDPALPLRVAAARSRRRSIAKSSRRDATAWLRSLRDGPLRVAAVFAEPAPYRSPLLDRLAARPELDLTVLYAGANVARRTWQVDLHHPHVVLSGARIPGLRRILRHDYPVTRGVWRELDRLAPDVLVAQGWSTFAAQAAVLWARRRHVPYVLQTESNERDPRSAWRRAVKDAVLPRLVRGAAGVLVTGSLAREAMARRGARRIAPFSATVDVAAFAARADMHARRRLDLRAAVGLGDGDVAILCAARLVPEKDVATLVRAVAETRDARLVLVLAGDGPERGQLERLASELGVRAVFLDDVAWERMGEIYAAADVFALLSTHEPWGVVVIEAAACGLPLVLSEAVGAGYDLVRPGENGEIVAVGDVPAAAEALRVLAADPELRSRRGAASRRLAADWGYERSAAGFLELVELAARGG